MVVIIPVIKLTPPMINGSIEWYFTGNELCAKFIVPVSDDKMITGKVNHIVNLTYIKCVLKCIHRFDDAISPHCFKSFSCWGCHTTGLGGASTNGSLSDASCSPSDLVFVPTPLNLLNMAFGLPAAGLIPPGERSCAGNEVPVGLDASENKGGLRGTGFDKTGGDNVDPEFMLVRGGVFFMATFCLHWSCRNLVLTIFRVIYCKANNHDYKQPQTIVI